MNKSIFYRLITFSCLVAVLTLVFVIQSKAQGFGGNPFSPRNTTGDVKTEIVSVHQFGTTTVIPQAGASLSRNNEGVLGTISTSGLTPGHVITLWWAIFNNPEFCAVTICTPSDLNNSVVNGSLQYGGGTIADAGGRADFTGFLAERDNTGFYLLPQFPFMPNPAPGIVSAKKAQIHLVIRIHGMASNDPTTLNQQLTTFAGGCSVVPNPCANFQAAQFLNK